jgi:hypothetical protein
MLERGDIRDKALESRLITGFGSRQRNNLGYRQSRGAIKETVFPHLPIPDCAEAIPAGEILQAPSVAKLRSRNFEFIRSSAAFANCMTALGPPALATHTLPQRFMYGMLQIGKNSASVRNQIVIASCRRAIPIWTFASDLRNWGR